MESHFYPDKVQTGAIIIDNVSSKLLDAQTKVISASSLDGRILSRLSFNFQAEALELSNYNNSLKAIKQNIQNVINDYNKTMGKTTAMADSLGTGFDIAALFGGLASFFGNPLEAFDNAGKTVANFFENVTDSISSFFKDTGAAILDGASSLWDSFSKTTAGKYIINSWNENVLPLLSSAGMAICGLGQGIANVGEDIVDFVAIAGGAVGTIPAAITDGVSYLFTGEVAGAIDSVWDGVQGFVQETYVDNAFETFFSENEFGKAMNELAYEPMKYGEVGYGISNGVGYLAGLVGLTLLTAGVGTGVSTVGSMGGSMTKTSLNFVVKQAARSATKYGAAVSFAAGTGSGTEQAWNEGAATLDGALFGIANGAWESAQWLIGGKLAGLGSKAILADMGLGAAEVPFRSALENAYSKESFLESFENNGGFGGILTNIGIAGLFGGLGEVSKIKHFFGNDGVEAIKNNSSNLDDNLDIDSMFTIFNNNNRYGVNQGLFTNLRLEDPIAYNEIKKRLINEYNFNFREIERFMSTVDAVGACNYAAEANTIVSLFKDMPEKFEQIFGFPLYKQLADGNYHLNDTDILADLYIWGNLDSDQAILFKRNEIGQIVFDDNAIDELRREIGDTTGRVIPQRGGGMPQELINPYLQAKDPSLSCTVIKIGCNDIFENKTVSELSNRKLKELLLQKINDGYELGMGSIAKTNKVITYIDTNSNEKYAVAGGHWIKITNVTDDGIIASSWGKRCYVSFDDLKNNAFFDLYFTKLN